MVGTFNVLVFNKESNESCAAFVREKIREKVKNPAVAEKLVPTTHPIFTKRPCVDTGYFETFNRDNVELVDVRENPIETVTEKGIIAGGKEYEFDTLVLAIGFDAMMGAMTRIDIRGRGGKSVKQVGRKRGPSAISALPSPAFPTCS